MTTANQSDAIRETVRSRYAAAARAATELPIVPSTSCCGDSAVGRDPITADLYAVDELAELPDAAVLASLGCGNPTALAELRPGETVLDLGSGGGIDVLLSARRVGPTGFAYGLDMTDEMLALARKNAAERGANNVEFLKGEIESIPLPDSSVDVIISNCVINLSADKPQVLREAFRVLKPGGRFAVSDVVVQGELPNEIRRSLELWAGCISGALEEGEYRRLLANAGFSEADVEVTRVYDPEDLAASVSSGSCCGPTARPDLIAQSLAAMGTSGGRLVSAFVRASKPGESAGR